MGIFMLIFSLCRLLFYAKNSDAFPEAGLYDFLIGMWFDLISTSLLFLPLCAVTLFPVKDRNSNWHRWTTLILSTTLFFFALFFNLIDIGYFEFSGSRSSYSLFTMLGFGNDLSSQLPSYLATYWYLFLILFGLSFAFFWLYKKRSFRITHDYIPLSRQFIYYFFVTALLLLFARGGFVSKPIRPTEASKYTNPANAQLVLNSVFTVINSWGVPAIEEKEYMSKAEANVLFNPIHQYDTEGPAKGQNIMIIVLESFAIEYINSLNVDEEEYTPFFDQLVDSSLVFDWGFANGRKSIDAVPSILASVPKMMNDEYLLTPYSVNQVNSLPECLSELGYSTSFYHGANNGSMNFDAFTAHIGIDEYVGRNEYANDEHYDGTWGIYDHYFMPWVAKQLSDEKEPFFTTLFTISSHPPYDLPTEYEYLKKNAPSERHAAIQYTDIALQLFFEEASKQDWYENTLFILTADHTTGSSRRIYNHDRGQMHIPMIMYHPTDTFFRGHSDRIMGHIDIMPTLLDLAGYDKAFYSFGHSVFDSDFPPFTFAQIGGKTYLFEAENGHPHLLIFENDQATEMYHFLDQYQVQNMKDDKPELFERLEKRLKAIIQTHNSAVLHNETKAIN